MHSSRITKIQTNDSGIEEAWHWVSTLPVEQSLILGGGGSLAFFELARYARTFLQNNMQSVLGFLFPGYYDTTIAKNKTTLVKAIIANTINTAPLIARNGLVEAMLLTPIGIFYLKTDCLTLYRAQNYSSEGESSTNWTYEDHVRLAISKLSPHALMLYNKAKKQENGRDHSPSRIGEHLQNKFNELLDDCLLHMLLNDLSLMLRGKDTLLPTIKPIALNLIQKITLTTPNATSVWAPASFLKWVGYSTNKQAAASPKTSTQCLTEWTTQNATEIQQHIKTIFANYSTQTTSTKPNLFFRNPGDWRANSLEKTFGVDEPLDQWSRSFQATGCLWNRKIGPLQIELELLPNEDDDKNNDSRNWIKTARLRYTII